MFTRFRNESPRTLIQHKSGPGISFAFREKSFFRSLCDQSSLFALGTRNKIKCQNCTSFYINSDNFGIRLG